jgi:hypothetical protein
MLSTLFDAFDQKTDMKAIVLKPSFDDLTY